MRLVILNSAQVFAPEPRTVGSGGEEGEEFKFQILCVTSNGAENLREPLTLSF